MSDLVIGTIIGGAIGVIGSILGFIIQGYFSNKNTEMQIEARKEEQSRLFQHEKDSQVISRLIAVRSRYLEPLTNHLSNLYIKVAECAETLIEFITPYCIDKKTEKVKVSTADKREFIQKIGTIISMCSEITDLSQKVFRAGGQIGDGILIGKLATTTRGVGKVLNVRNEMYSSLNDTKEGEDFVYDFKPLWESLKNVGISISDAHGRIESLLAGAKEDNE